MPKERSVTASPAISCALVTRNRPLSLARTLRSVARQEPALHEVIVSDDSDEAYAAETRKIVRSFGYRYIAGPRKGLYANRNFVARQCAGTHIRSMDDDHEFPAGHFEAIRDAVAADPDCVWFIGECYPKEGGGFTPVACPGQLTASGFSELPSDPSDCWAISDGASVYPRAIFDGGHRFVDLFPFGASYLEFGSYLRHRDFRMRYLEGTHIVHHCDPLNRSIMDHDNDVASRIFAMLCHSFLYQRSARNRAVTATKLGRYLLELKAPLPAIRLAFDAFNQRRRELSAP